MTLSPFFTVTAPAMTVPSAPVTVNLLLLAVGPVMLIGLDAPVIPETVMGSEVISVLRATPVLVVKEN